MAATTAQSALLLPLVTIVATVFLHSIPAGAARASAGAPQNQNTEFIRRSCSTTLYPSLCYTSLVGYASAVAQDPTKLARVATDVSLARVRSVSAYVASLRRTAASQKVDARTASALQDCEETIGTAVDLTQRTTAELGLLPAAKDTEVAWRVSNAQTWMSAAITNEGTCVDGFSGVGSSAAIKADVSGRVGVAEQYTSNALALVNRLVGTNR